MADNILITCPGCGKQMKVPETTAGKKIRCPGCKGAVPVPAGKGKAADTRLTTEQVQRRLAAQRMEEEIARDPYAVQEMSMAPMCPFCAFELDPPDARICLNCGYDMVQRARVASKKVYERTASDFILWHLPTLACFLAIVAMVCGFIYYHYWLPEVVLDSKAAAELAKDRWEYLSLENENVQFVGFMFHPGIELWLVVVGLFLSWKCGKFVFKRLFFHFLPEEHLKIEKEE